MIANAHSAYSCGDSYGLTPYSLLNPPSERRLVTNAAKLSVLRLNLQVLIDFFSEQLLNDAVGSPHK